MRRIWLFAIALLAPLSAIRDALTPDVTEPITLKAIVLLDPFTAVFGKAGLAAVTMPVLLVRPEDSALGAAGNALALKAD